MRQLLQELHAGINEVSRKRMPQCFFLNANGINSSNNMTSGINDGNNIYNSNPYNTTNGIIVITNGIND